VSVKGYRWYRVGGLDYLLKAKRDRDSVRTQVALTARL